MAVRIVIIAFRSSRISVFASNPPTQSEVQQIINYLNDLLDTMKR